MERNSDMEGTVMYEEKAIDRTPVGALGLVPLESCNQLAQKVDGYLVNWRNGFILNG